VIEKESGSFTRYGDSEERKGKEDAVNIVKNVLFACT